MKDYNVAPEENIHTVLIRSNGDCTNGKYIATTAEYHNFIVISYSLRSFFANGILCYLHELYHSWGMNHNDSVDLARENLFQFSGLKYHHLFSEVINEELCKKIIYEHKIKVKYTVTPDYYNRTIIGEYNKIAANLDLFSEATIKPIGGGPINYKDLIDTDGKLMCQINLKGIF